MRAVIDPLKCDPSHCASGRCAARSDCPAKAIWQEMAEDVPMLDPSRCHGCSKCVARCPLKAISLVS